MARRVIQVLLFPFLMLTMLVSVYTAGMHSPTPHHLKVAVAGAQAPAVADALRAGVGDSYDVTTVGTADEARRLVEERDVAAAYIPAPEAGDRAAGVASPTFAQQPEPSGPVLYVASGAGASRVSMAAAPFQNVAVQQGQFLQVRDLVPLDDSDSSGTTMLYASIGLTLAAYLPMVILPMTLGAGFTLRVALTTLTAWGAFASFVTWLIAGPIIGALDVPLPSFLVTGMLTVLAVGLATGFLGRIFGQLATLPAIFLFMFAAVPASGAALPIEAMPGFFRALHDVLPLTATSESVRGLMYFGSEGIAGHWAVLAAWAAGALALTFGFDLLKRRRAAGGDDDASGPGALDAGTAAPAV